MKQLILKVMGLLLIGGQTPADQPAVSHPATRTDDPEPRVPSDVLRVRTGLNDSSSSCLDPCAEATDPE